MDWAKAIQDVTPADLAEIDARIMALDAELASLRSLRRVMEARLRPVPAPPPRAPRSGKPTTRPSVTEQQRLDVLHYLARYDQAMPIAISGDLDIAHGSMPKILDYPWFEKTESGAIRLTLEGRLKAAVV